jgi:hypothetical protein
MEILTVAAEFFRADRERYMKRLIVASRSFRRHLTGQQEMMFGRVPQICFRYGAGRLQQGSEKLEEGDRGGHGSKKFRRDIEEEEEEGEGEGEEKKRSWNKE